MKARSTKASVKRKIILEQKIYGVPFLLVYPNVHQLGKSSMGAYKQDQTK